MIVQKDGTPEIKIQRKVKVGTCSVQSPGRILPMFSKTGTCVPSVAMMLPDDSRPRPVRQAGHMNLQGNASNRPSINRNQCW